jgi:hypothetical protein
MAERWFETLRPLCRADDVVLFYLARWCQKKTKEAEPDVGTLDPDAVREAAANIARNLAQAGEQVERLARGDAHEMNELGRLLFGTALRRVPEAAAREYAHEAVQDVLMVLVTGKPPSEAAAHLEGGPEGPANEYVFQSPFSLWAQSVVIHRFIDDYRRWVREREGPAPPPRARPGRHLKSEQLHAAAAALPELLEAIRKLPAKQRSVIVLSLACANLDELAREHLCALAQDFFHEGPPEVGASDRELAEHLGTVAHNVTANRSVARRKLARRDERWELLLDALLPHATTSPIAKGRETAVR